MTNEQARSLFVLNNANKALTMLLYTMDDQTRGRKATKNENNLYTQAALTRDRIEEVLIDTRINQILTIEKPKGPKVKM